jgi:hypothetical protein
MTHIPKMYEVWAAEDILHRATDDQIDRLFTLRGRTARQRAMNAYKGSTVQKAQRKPRPTGEGWDPEHQIIVTLSKTTKKGK